MSEEILVWVKVENKFIYMYIGFLVDYCKLFFVVVFNNNKSWLYIILSLLYNNLGYIL